jgi:hypothetical protein
LFAEEAKHNGAQSSDGNFVNVGNFDSDGLNVNNDDRSNSNSNLGVCPSRKFRQWQNVTKVFREGGPL